MPDVYDTDLSRLESALAESQEHIRRLELLNHLQQQIIVSGSVSEIDAIAFEHLRALMPVAAGSLLLDAYPAAAAILAAHLPTASAPGVNDLPVEWPGLPALKAGQPWLSNDLASLPAFAGRETLLAAGMLAVLDLPLLVDGRLLGVLCLSAGPAQAYQPAQVQAALDVAGVIALAMQHARQFESERERRREFEMIHSLTQAMRGALTQQDLYSIFLPEVLILAGAQGGAVFLPKETAEPDFVLGQSAGWPSDHAPQQAVLQQAMRQVIAERQLLFLPDRSCAVLPLQVGSQLFSLLVLLWPEPLRPNLASHNLLLTIGELLSIAISRLSARETLEQKVNQRTRELMALYEITRLYVSNEDIQTIAENSLRVVLNVLNARAGLIHLVNPLGPSVNVVAHLGLDASLLAEALDYDANSSEWQRITQSGSPLLVHNLPGRDDLPGAIARSGYQSILASPIRASEATLGAISLFYQGETVLSVEDLNLVDLIADQLGMVIERSQLRQKASAAAILEERHRLARDLHDSVSQSLYSLSFMADALRNLAEQQQWGRMQSQLGFLQESAQQALKEMRLLVYELTPASLEAQGLANVIRQRLNYVEKRAGMETDLVVDGDLSLPVAVQLGVYRIAQEALNNVIKHAYAKRVQVTLHTRPPGLWLQVKDDGVGFDLEQQAPGMGQRNMRERAVQLGGRLVIESQPGAGTCVMLTIDEVKP